MFNHINGHRGNKYTLISIVLILAVLYVYRLTIPQKDNEYPEYIHYMDNTYRYSETIRKSPITLKRLSGSSDEGHIILAERGGSSDEIYIYKGKKWYRRYLIENQ